ncbi:MAG: hypothetical protein JWM19_7487 [Actinomycetia bacterium]|nr:hypothetical protein [Actinomycetes bacterium]
MTARTVSEAPASPSSRRGLVPARILRMELRRSAFIWVIPLLAVLFIYDPYRTASTYSALWPLRSTVVLNKFWPDIVVFAAGFSAWSGTREGRRNLSDLLGTTARTAWTRQLCSLAGTAFWVVASFLAGTVVLYVSTSQAATWGGPLIWPVIVGVVGMLAICAVSFMFGALFPGRFTAPVVAVGITIVTLAAFRQAVGDNGGSSGAIGVLSPDGSVPGNDWGLFYPVSVGVPIVQVMFMLGVTLAAIGVLGLSPRTGGVGWRGALSAVAAGGARLRTIAVSLLAVGVALAVVAFGLAETANVSDPTSTLQIPAIDNTLAFSNAIPYTPACSSAGSAFPAGGFQICVHPAYQPYLPWVTGALYPVIAEVSGAPGVPTTAREISASSLPPEVLQGFAIGQIVGGTYQFSLSNVLGFSPTASELRNSLQQDLVRAVIIGSSGKFVTTQGGQQAYQPDFGTSAQQAVMDGLLESLGAQPYPRPQPGGNGPAVTPAQILAAAAKFAVLPAATRHAWLAANLTALKAGTITLAQVP